MSKRQKRIDPSQLSFSFDEQIEAYTNLKTELLSTTPKPTKNIETYEEACIELAAALKRSLRTQMSREELVDAINEYFGWRRSDGKQCSIHMLNHYLSKPTEYPIPAFYIFAIQRITGSLEPTKVLAEAEEAKVISKDEVRAWALGKLDESIIEMQRLKKELRLKK